MNQDPFQGAKEETNYNVPLWDFAQKPNLVGKLIKKTTPNSEFSTVLYQFETAEGNYAVWGSYQLEQFLSDKKLGTKIGLQFVEEIDIGEGKKVKSFKKFVFPAEEE